MGSHAVSGCSSDSAHVELCWSTEESFHLRGEPHAIVAVLTGPVTDISDEIAQISLWHLLILALDEAGVDLLTFEDCFAAQIVSDAVTDLCDRLCPSDPAVTSEMIETLRLWGLFARDEDSPMGESIEGVQSALQRALTAMRGYGDIDPAQGLLIAEDLGRIARKWVPG